MKQSTLNIVIGSLFILLYLLYLFIPSEGLLNPADEIFYLYFLFFVAICVVQFLTGIFTKIGYYQKKVYFSMTMVFMAIILILGFIQTYKIHRIWFLSGYVIVGILVMYMAYNRASLKTVYLETMKEFRDKLKTNPDNYKVWYNYGNALMEIKEYKRAIELYDKALEINPEYAKAFYNKGIALAHINKYKKAIKAYDQVIEIDPDNIKAWINKGNSLATIGKRKEAMECYDRAMEIDPENANAKLNKKTVIESKNECGC